jgi:hypothetical protein
MYQKQPAADNERPAQMSAGMGQPGPPAETPVSRHSPPIPRGTRHRGRATTEEVILRNGYAPPLVVVALVATVLASSCGSSQSSASSSLPKPASGKITVSSTETLSPQDVTNGGVAGTGHFTISGAITDVGTVVDYRTVKGTKVLIRRVVVGKKGTITFLITLGGTLVLGRWTITSATKSYKGLHGSGEQTVDNYQSDPATFALTGTVSQ